VKFCVVQSPKYAGLAFVVVAAGAACSGNGTTLPTCPVPLQPVFAMIDPSPGATGVPDNLGEIVFEGFGPKRVTLTGGTQTIALTLEPAPTPTPTPQGALPQLIAALSTPLSASTTYTAKYTATVSGSDCASRSYTADAGSFTTQ
jgi:hypothetical protein